MNRAKFTQLKRRGNKCLFLSLKKIEGIISYLFFVKMYCCLKRLIFITIARQLLKKIEKIMRKVSRLHSTSRKNFYFFLFLKRGKKQSEKSMKKKSHHKNQRKKQK